MKPHQRILTSVEEDFRAIGLLPPLTESDDPTKPRDIPSPAPEAAANLDDSEGDKSAHMAGAKQPKPKMGPADDDADKSGYDPESDGGPAKGASKSHKAVQGSKEASLESKQYSTHAKQPMKGAKKGEKPEIARGLPPVKKLAGMKESRVSQAINLINAVRSTLDSVKVEEEVSELCRGFQLVAEDAALLSNRLAELGEEFDVDALTSEMDDLSADAVQALEAVEAELAHVGDGTDEDDAIRHSGDVSESDEGKLPKSDRNADEPYDIPSPAFKEDAERLLQAMFAKLMDAVEIYDSTLDTLHESMDMEGGDDGHVHVHTKGVHVHAGKVHIHHGDDDADADQSGEPGDDPDHDPHAEMGAHDDGDQDPDADADADHDGDADAGDDGDQDDSGDSDEEHNSLMARMNALRHRRAAMHGKDSFQGDEEDESAY